MVANGAVVLVNTSMVAAGSNVSLGIGYNGAQGVLVIAGNTMPLVLNVMLTGVGNTNRVIKVNSGATIVEGVYPLNAPAGQYVVHTVGSSIGLYVALVPTI